METRIHHINPWRRVLRIAELNLDFLEITKQINRSSHDKYESTRTPEKL